MSNVISTNHLAVSAVPARRIARFGVFELDLRSGDLRRSGVRVPLQDQPFRLLAFLIERGGEVVTREELRERLWPAEFVDFEQGLNTAVRKLRAALDDSAESARFIETLPRRGYRFIAPVVWNESSVAANRRQLPRALAAVIAIAVLLTIGAAILHLRPRAAAPATIDSVAVLPFTIDEPSGDHVSDGLTEVLIDSLSRHADLRVTSRATAFRYRGTADDPQELGRKLEVAAIVVGDIRRKEGTYDIRVDLIDVASGAQLWGERFRVPPAQLASVQRRISDALSTRLRPASATGARYTSNAEAYELYLKGLYVWNRRSKNDLPKAVDYFTRATELDPSFAAAYAGLANTWGVMVGYDAIPAESGALKVLAAAQKALELDPSNAEAYTSIATTKFRNLWDFKGAEADYRRALALNPNYATGHQWYSDYLRAMGRFAEARREIDTAYHLDPLSTATTAARCWAFFNERRYREAVAFGRQAGELDPRFGGPHCVGQSLAALGDYEGLFAELQRVSPDSDAPRQLAAAYRAGGRDALYRTRLELLLGAQGSEERHVLDIAETYAILGESDKAFQWLEKAYDRRVPRLTSFHINPSYDSLRDDPRFHALVERIGLPHFDVIAAAAAVR